jgi:biotin synthase
MKNQLMELFQENTGHLFSEAQKTARELPVLLATPVAFTTACNIVPPCGHCWWRATARTNGAFIHTSTRDEAIEKSKKAAFSGIKRILIPSGWLGLDLPGAFYDHVRLVKDAVGQINPGIEVFATCGHISKKSLLNLKAAGLDGYWCGLEVPNAELFQRVRPGDSLTARVQTIEDTAAVGLKIWSGFLFGVGESEPDIIRGIQTLEPFGLDSFSLTPFKQFPYIELEKYPPANLFDWARTAAVIRLYFGKINVFASPEFANWGFRAGANAFLPVTVNNKKVPGFIDELTRLRISTYTLNSEINQDSVLSTMEAEGIGHGR